MHSISCRNKFRILPNALSLLSRCLYCRVVFIVVLSGKFTPKCVFVGRLKSFIISIFLLTQPQLNLALKNLV